jgi:dTDP-4-dehydrorhamnose reductase
MKIVGTGLSGLIGSRIVELLQPEYSFENLSLETGVDITDEKKLSHIISNSDAPWVFHFAAKTDVDGCELDRTLKQHGAAWTINVQATANIAEICRSCGKHMLYLSTDYVFSGDDDEYSETDKPDPPGWYGITKYEGEKSVMSLGKYGLVIRTSNPYRVTGPGKTDFVHKILDRLDQGLPVKSPTDSTMKATFVDDIAKVIRILIVKSASGIYHAVGADTISPYQATKTIASVFGKDDARIYPTTFAEFFQGRAPRPLHAALKNVKITHYGINMLTLSEGLSQVKIQEKENVI